MAGRNKNTIGVILLNLGGPDSLSAVRPFLCNLFSDREIIKLGPSFLQKPVAWMISVLRSKKAEKMYSLIGGKSPILDITKAQAEALEKALNQSTPTLLREAGQAEHRAQQTDNPPLPPFNKGGMGGFDSKLSFRVYIGMRYWHPFIMDTVDKIQRDGIKHLIVLSLYPHYSKTTTGSAVSEFKRAIAPFTIHDSQFMIKYIEQWYDYPLYIDSLAELMGKGISEFKSPHPPFASAPRRIRRGEKGGLGGITVLYSAHSLPEVFIREGDPYLDHIKATISALNSSLVTRHSSPLRWHLSFQSKTGPVKWLEPSTEETIIKLSTEGCKNLFVVPISFVSDHIETLYEIDILYKKLAEKHGIQLERCESLNTSEKFIDALKELVLRETQMLNTKERK